MSRGGLLGITLLLFSACIDTEGGSGESAGGRGGETQGSGGVGGPDRGDSAGGNATVMGCPSWQAGCPCSSPPPQSGIVCLPRLDAAGAAGASGEPASLPDGGLSAGSAGSGFAGAGGVGGTFGSVCPEFEPGIELRYMLFPATPCGWVDIDLTGVNVEVEQCCFHVMGYCDACL